MDYEQLYRQLLAQQQMGGQSGNMGGWGVNNPLQGLMQGTSQANFTGQRMPLQQQYRPDSNPYGSSMDMMQRPQMGTAGTINRATAQPLTVRAPVARQPAAPVAPKPAWQTNHAIAPPVARNGISNIDKNRWGAIGGDWWANRNKMQSMIKPTTPQYHQNATI